ncbi:Rho GTPase activation protein [Lipomyces chichibuensis]|uniref:Rho GTPase activation protein n=1 Tax=Lipomyces chichibuensis TaxID=1546026 RepID=UPI0033430A5E
MIANERSSVLGAHDNDDSELSPPRKTLDVDDETAKLKYELVRASQRIVELEALLKIGEPDTTALEKTIEERRRTIADLEAQTTVIRKEYEVMRGGQAAEDEYDEGPNELLRRFRDEMEATKNGLQAEIQELISQRNELLDENLRLTKLRQDAVQQAEHLNAKNQQLADLNNELTRQIQERFKTHKGSPIARPVYSFQPSLVNAGNSNSNAGGKKKFWHRGGAAVAKGAVKGFNKMFSSDGGNSTGQWSSSSNGADTFAQDSATTGGLNILMPTSVSASSGLSSAGNNSYKPGGVVRTTNFKVSSADEPESSLFGVDIVKRTESEGRAVPFIVTRCIQEVEIRGMDYEGIYRKSGIKSQSDMIRSMFENDFDAGDDKFHELMQGDICGVTSALKQYLRHLPVPLVTYDSYSAFIAVAEHDDFERKIYRLTQIMKSLPRAHQNCLECIVQHLSRVVSHSDKNLMTSLNLAVVFAPTLVRDYSGTREMVDAHKRNEVIRFMIENSDRIFATDVSLV